MFTEYFIDPSRVPAIHSPECYSINNAASFVSSATITTLKPQTTASQRFLYMDDGCAIYSTIHDCS